MRRRELFSFLSSSIKGEKRDKAIPIIRPPYFNDISAFDKECVNCDGLCATSCQEHIIIIAEDNNSDEVAKFVENIKIDNVLVYHTFQEDNGWQRNKSTNNALRVAKSDYLIWIDGDCIPYPTLVESHIALCENNTVLCGRRAEPGEKFSTALRKKQISVDAFLKNYIKNFLCILFRVNPKSRNSAV